tara:strand:+ start:1073 stop:1213 length:141 start_codon:yes stop_codon:yes gene_type:complete
MANWGSAETDALENALEKVSIVCELLIDACDDVETLSEVDQLMAMM